MTTLPVKAVVLHSGGLDSTVLLYFLHKKYAGAVASFSVDYGQRHCRELMYAATSSAELGVKHVTANLTSLRQVLAGSSQTSSNIDVPEGHYTDESMKATVVPNRNMVLLSVAAGYAINVGADEVAYAAHRGDHPIYPDCRPEFIDAMGDVLALCHFTPVNLTSPFSAMTKGEVVALGYRLHVPFALTWSCYVGSPTPCGKCGTCVERAEAFLEAGLRDPLLASPTMPTHHWPGY